MAKINTDPLLIKNLLSRGTEEVIEKDHLEKRLLAGERLRIKFGVDPTGSLLHLGHAVPLRKMQQFLELGHEVILLIGDFTAMIGDPSGRLEARPPLSAKEVKENMKNYLKQAEKVLNVKKVEVRRSSKWFDKRKADFFMELASRFTYTRLMDRAEFKERVAKGGDVTLLELMYPLLQGYDSVILKADVEIGGTDQKFNLLMGRKVQKRYGLPEQDILTVPLLVGTDGSRKMSKTGNNFIALTDSAQDIFAKVMSIPDHLVKAYAEIFTDWPLAELEATSEIFFKKQNLAEEIARQLAGEKEAEKARVNFERVFGAGELPEKIEEIVVGFSEKKAVDLLADLQLLTSRGEAKRLIEQGGLKADGKTVKNWNVEIKVDKNGTVLKVGSHQFYKLVRKN